MHCVRAAQSLRTGFGHAEVTDFAFPNKFLHGANSVFDWRVGIDSMLVIEVDVIDAEPAQASLARAADIIGFSADTPSCGVIRIAHITEFCGEHDFVAASFNGFANQ